MVSQQNRQVPTQTTEASWPLWRELTLAYYENMQYFGIYLN